MPITDFDESGEYRTDKVGKIGLYILLLLAVISWSGYRWQMIKQEERWQQARIEKMEQQRGLRLSEQDNIVQERYEELQAWRDSVVCHWVYLSTDTVWVSLSTDTVSVR